MLFHLNSQFTETDIKPWYVNYNSKKPAHACKANQTDIKLYLRLDGRDIFSFNTFSFLYGASDT
jgi:hypothetical protein